MFRPILVSLALVLGLLVAGCKRYDGIPPIPDQVVGSCTYTNNFSRREECREYRGTGWSAQDASNDCRSRNASINLGQGCGYPEVIGYCILDWDTTKPYRISFPGNAENLCGSSRTGCEFFGGGVFVPAGPCGSVVDTSATGGLAVFQPPTLDCRAPRAGEPAGRGPNGQVCTWTAVAGSTEEGRHYENYASCDVVRTQRPYGPKPPGARSGMTDPRMNDPAYTAELNWVRSQVESSACICCHSSRTTPNGPSNWYVEAPGNWMDSFGNLGLALGAGWVNSDALGAYPAAQNNGFARDISGMPSTDPQRMKRFFESELAYRGATRDDFAAARPFGGPIYDQLVYEPTDCRGGEGVRADGQIRWNGGTARYLYVLEQGSRNPGVPPNLDLPAGTVWRIDAPWMGEAFPSGITYGQLPINVMQKVPATGAPPALVNGRKYYLYVLADVGIPIARCNFTYPVQ